jgi:hypothetical protein
LKNGRWVLEAKRAVVGQQIHINKRRIYLRRGENIWLQISLNRVDRDDQDTWASDMVNIAVDVQQVVSFA